MDGHKRRIKIFISKRFEIPEPKVIIFYARGALLGKRPDKSMIMGTDKVDTGDYDIPETEELYILPWRNKNMAAN